MLPADRGAQDCPRWFEQKNEHLSTPVPPVTFKAPSDWTRESIPPCSSLQLHTALIPSAVNGIRAEHQQPPWYQPMGKLSSTNRAPEDFPATKEGNTTLMTQRPRRHVAQQSRKSITITMSMIHHHHCHHQSCPDSPITPPTTTLNINPIMLKWSHHHNITTATNHVKSASLPTSSITSHQSHHNSTVTIDHISPAPAPTSPPLIPISTINIGTSLPPPVITIITTNTITSVPSVMPHRHYRHITTTAPSIISRQHLCHHRSWHNQNHNYITLITTTCLHHQHHPNIYIITMATTDRVATISSIIRPPTQPPLGPPSSTPSQHPHNH